MVSKEEQHGALEHDIRVLNEYHHGKDSTTHGVPQLSLRQKVLTYNTLLTRTNFAVLRSDGVKLAFSGLRLYLQPHDETLYTDRLQDADLDYIVKNAGIGFLQATLSQHDRLYRDIRSLDSNPHVLCWRAIVCQLGRHEVCANCPEWPGLAPAIPTSSILLVKSAAKNVSGSAALDIVEEKRADSTAGRDGAALGADSVVPCGHGVDGGLG